jgi:hypothetical protein
MYWPNISKCRVAAFNWSRRRDKVLELSFLVGGIRDIVGLQKLEVFGGECFVEWWGWREC